MTQLTIISVYLGLLLFLGVFSSKMFRGTSKDYLLASHSIGPFLLLMSLFGTTMTAFALVGSTGESFKKGVGVYGMLASSSGMIHSLCFLVLGVKLWSWGKKYGYTTQIQFFRDRLESDKIGILLFPVLVGLVIPYLLIGVMASGTVISSITEGAFQNTFAAYDYGIPPWLGSLVISCVVLIYVFFGGMRGTAWANTFQTIIFMVLGVVTFFIISDKLGGMQAASEAVLKKNPSKLTRGVDQKDEQNYEKRYAGWEKKAEYLYTVKVKGNALTPDETKQALGKFKPRMPDWRTVAKTAFAFQNKKEWFSQLTIKDKSKARILQDDRLIPDPFPEEYTKEVIDAHGLTMLKRRPLSEIKKDAHRKFEKKIGHPNEFLNPKDESKGKKWSLKKAEGVYRATTWAPQKPIPIPMLAFLTYMFVPLSVGMFPHLFQHWLTAKSANSFKLPVVAHPIFIMIVWVPCVLVGIWATSATLNGKPLIPPHFPPNAVLAYMVKSLAGPVLAGFLTAGILAAIMSSLDSQFLCIGTIFTEDIVLHYSAKNKFTDRQIILMARLFIISIVALTYFFSLQEPRRVFTLGVWCFSGFSSLFPLILAAVYWRRLTKPGAYASILTSVVIWCSLFYKSNYAANADFLFLEMMPVATMIACSTAALVLVSLATKPPGEETLAKFFPQKT